MERWGKVAVRGLAMTQWRQNNWANEWIFGNGGFRKKTEFVKLLILQRGLLTTDIPPLDLFES